MGISTVLSIIFIEVIFILSMICLQTFFYFRTIGLSQKWRGFRLALAMLIVTVIEVALQIVILNTAYELGILFLLILILHPVFFMGGKLFERVFFGIINLAIFMFSLLITSIIMWPQSLIVENEQLFSIVTLQLFALLITIYAILVLVITHLSTEGKRYIPHKYWAGTTICFSIICIGLFVIYYFTNPMIEHIERLHTYLTISTLSLLVIWLLSYFIFYSACRYLSKATEATTLLVHNDMIERYMMRKQASDERIKILSHDLKHSLTQWRALAEEKGDTGALQSISEYEGQLASSLMINVENENANAIINQKCWEANQERIEFLTDGAFHKDLLMNKLDLCSLLGNLLDNAIEAAAQAEAEALRRVKLSIRRKGNLLIMVVENGYALEPVIVNSVFVTSKKDTNHQAIGMRSIRYVAEKYDGVVKNSYENNWFKATIMLRGYKIALSDKK